MVRVMSPTSGLRRPYGIKKAALTVCLGYKGVTISFGPDARCADQPPTCLCLATKDIVGALIFRLCYIFVIGFTCVLRRSNGVEQLDH